MEVEKLVLISGVYPTAVCQSNFLMLLDNRLRDEMSDLGDGEVSTFLSRIAIGRSLEVVHLGTLVDQI